MSWNLIKQIMAVISGLQWMRMMKFKRYHWGAAACKVAKLIRYYRLRVTWTGTFGDIVDQICSTEMTKSV